MSRSPPSTSITPRRGESRTLGKTKVRTQRRWGMHGMEGPTSEQDRPKCEAKGLARMKGRSTVSASDYWNGGGGGGRGGRGEDGGHR